MRSHNADSPRLEVKRAVLFISRAFVLFGSFMLLMMCLAAYRLYRLHREGRPAEAVVVEYIESHGRREIGGSHSTRKRYETYTTYSPVFEFEADGRAIRFRSPQVDYHKAFRIGEKVEILYDPKDPGKAEVSRRVKKFGKLWKILIAMACGGLVFVVCGRLLPRLAERF